MNTFKQESTLARCGTQGSHSHTRFQNKVGKNEKKIKNVTRTNHNPPAEDLLEADGLLADDILSLDLAEPCPLSLEGGVGCFISGTRVLLVGGARPP